MENKKAVNLCILKEHLGLGGTERSASNISKILENDYNVYLLVFDGQNVKYSYGGELIDIDTPPSKNIFLKVLNTFIRYFKIKRQIKNKKIDIVFDFLPIENPLSFVRYGKTARIISARDFSKMKNFTSSFKKALNRADAMVCNSEYIKEFYLSSYPEDRHKVFSVYNIIDTESIVLQADEAAEDEFCDFIAGRGKNLVSTGRFCKEKGFEYLLEAFAAAKKSVDGLGLVLVGDGALREKYDAIIERLGIKEDVYFTGFQSNPYKYMAKCSAYVLSSVSEGFPNVLAEAMALSLPVISTNCYSGPAEILRLDGDYNKITDNFNECDFGIMVPGINDDNTEIAVKCLSEAIVHLISDSDLIEKYSRLSLQRAIDFSAEAAKTKLVDVFRLLM